MFVKMLTDMHMVVYIWWCWHICKGEGVGVDQLEEEEKGVLLFSGHLDGSWSEILL